MQFGAVRFVIVIISLIPASGWAQDVTGSEPPSETTTPVTEDSTGTAGTIGTTSLETLGDVSNVSSTDPQQPENQTQTDSSPPPAALTTANLPVSALEQSENATTPGVVATTSEPDLTTTVLPQTNTTTTNGTSSTSQQETPGTTTTTTIQPGSTTTLRAIITTSAETNSTNITEVSDVSTTGTLNSTTIAPSESTSSSTNAPTTTSPATTAQPTTSANPETTTERRVTTISPATTTRRSSSTTQPSHECVTSAPCVDPNAHCVNRAGRNTCQCRIGFLRNSPNGKCLSIIPATTTTTSSPLKENVTSPLPTTPEPLPVPVKKNMVRKASELNKYEKKDVVSMSLLPATSVVEWLLEQDLPFREAIARILTSTNFTLIEESETSKTINVTADQVLYVAPSPQLTKDGLLVSFLVQDKEGVTPRHHSPLGRIIARHKRDANSTENITTGYLPSVWIITALRNRQHHLEVALNQTISSLYGGVVPHQLYSLEQFASASLFERRLDIFIPLILVAAICFMVLAVSLVCIRAKTKSMATWDPPAGVVFGKTSIKKENREDPLGCTGGKSESVGHHLASDEQCRDGEEQLMKHSSHIHADDDVWVVPYDDAPSHGQPSHLKTQYEDTKL